MAISNWHIYFAQCNCLDVRLLEMASTIEVEVSNENEADKSDSKEDTE